MARDMVRGWVRDAERDVAPSEKLDAATLFVELMSACADTVRLNHGGTMAGPGAAGLMHATQRVMVVAAMLEEACAREKGRQ